MYLAIKHLHLTFAMISIIGFVARSLWLFTHANWQKPKWVKILPHINDTLLLAVGIYLMILLQQYPFVHGWITAKLAALIVYILAGVVVMRQGATKAGLAAFGICLLSFGYMVSVAIQKSPLPYL